MAEVSVRGQQGVVGDSKAQEHLAVLAVVVLAVRQRLDGRFGRDQRNVRAAVCP